MRLYSWFRLTLLAGAAVALSACSYIADLFPDKQKEYRYSSELPDLEVPPDLGAVAAAAKEPKVAEASDDSKPAAEDQPKAKKKRKAAKPKDAEATLAESADNAALIEVSEPFPEAWNDVSRALGRLKIEISDQNRSDGVFYVYYGGEAPKKEEDKGFWDDVGTVFNIEPDKAQEYRVKLEDREDFTFIRIYDADNKAISDGKGLELLKRLHKKLITLNQPEPEEVKRSEEDDKDKEKPAADKP
ncbi:MAG: outer membrane protein assembly factor BamC [Candidatus Methylumidiphilus sp.]